MTSVTQLDSQPVTIGRLASTSGVPATTLRYYEREGLLAPIDRSRSGYRLYDEAAAQRLSFIRSAQAVGFTLNDIRELLKLDKDSSCSEVQVLLERRLAEVKAKLADLACVRDALTSALAECRRSRRGCRVLADLRHGRRVRRAK
ncbi:MAG: heavy metal-responsive transcriptional regulator [Planctomycetes bacterium]|nr:heavy metal-responsive transcriptional regulator [Planctomycetota bacterium]